MSPRRVLIVDDEKGIREALKQVLEALEGDDHVPTHLADGRVVALAPADQRVHGFGGRLPEGVELYLEQVAENGKLFVYVTVGNLPSSPPERQACLEHMLALNCLEQGTLCGTLAIDGLTDTVLLQAGIAEADLSVTRVEQAAQELLHHRPRIADSLGRLEAGGAPPKNAAQSTMAQLNRRIVLGAAQ